MAVLTKTDKRIPLKKLLAPVSEAPTSFEEQISRLRRWVVATGGKVIPKTD